MLTPNAPGWVLCYIMKEMTEATIIHLKKNSNIHVIEDSTQRKAHVTDWIK